MGHPSLRVDVRAILEDLGGTVELDCAVALPPIVVGTEEYPPIGEAALEAVLTNTGAGVVLSGTIEACVQAVCSRCLKEFPLTLAAELDGFYVAHGDEVDLPEEQEFGFIEEGAVDIMDSILAALTLEVPFAPLHDEDCAGICPNCGVDRNESACTCEPEAPASPFAALRDLLVPDEPPTTE